MPGKIEGQAAADPGKGLCDGLKRVAASHESVQKDNGVEIRVAEFSVMQR